MRNWCELCRSTGLVRAYNPWFIACITRNRKRVEVCGTRYKLWVRDGKGWRLNIGAHCEVPCKCKLGNPHLIFWKRGPNGNLVPKKWNGHSDEQARFGECWWHVRALTVNEIDAENVTDEHHMAWIHKRISNAIAPPNPKHDQTEADYFDGEDDPAENQFEAAMAAIDDDPFSA